MPAQGEINSLIKSAENKLRDAQNQDNSSDSRFGLAYDAAFGFALAALRWHGFRPDEKQRYIVFQLLQHTLSVPAEKWRVLAECHKRRNVTLYDGDLIEDEPLIAELIAVAKEVHAAVLALGPIAP